MSRVKSKKYTGVYLNKLADGDTSYSITYKDEDNKTKRFTVSKKSAGITILVCPILRNFYPIILLRDSLEVMYRNLYKAVLSSLWGSRIITL